MSALMSIQKYELTNLTSEIFHSIQYSVSAEKIINDGFSYRENV